MLKAFANAAVSVEIDLFQESLLIFILRASLIWNFCLFVFSLSNIKVFLVSIFRYWEAGRECVLRCWQTELVSDRWSLKMAPAGVEILGKNMASFLIHSNQSGDSCEDLNESLIE